jgi:hypothetical protein
MSATTNIVLGVIGVVVLILYILRRRARLKSEEDGY